MDKFKSRKFLLAILSAVGGIAISLSALPGKVGIISAVVSAIVPPVTYIITEGVVDAKAVGMLCDAISTTAELVEDIEKEDDEVKG